MAWINPRAAAPEYDGRMPEDEKVRLRLVNCSVGLSTRSFDGKEPQPQITLEWVTVDPQFAEFKVMDWVGFSFGKSKNTGAPSKLRQLINAVEGRAHDADITDSGGIDGETLEYSIDGSQIDGKIKPGIEVDVIGNTREKKGEDGETYRVWRIEKYRAISNAVKATTVKNGNGRPPVKAAEKPDFAKSEAGF